MNTVLILIFTAVASVSPQSLDGVSITCGGGLAGMGGGSLEICLSSADGEGCFQAAVPASASCPVLLASVSEALASLEPGAPSRLPDGRLALRLPVEALGLVGSGLGDIRLGIEDDRPVAGRSVLVPLARDPESHGTNREVVLTVTGTGETPRAIRVQAVAAGRTEGAVDRDLRILLEAQGFSTRVVPVSVESVIGGAPVSALLIRPASEKQTLLGAEISPAGREGRVLLSAEQAIPLGDEAIGAGGFVLERPSLFRVGRDCCVCYYYCCYWNGQDCIGERLAFTCPGSPVVTNRCQDATTGDKIECAKTFTWRPCQGYNCPETDNCTRRGQWCKRATCTP